VCRSSGLHLRSRCSGHETALSRARWCPVAGLGSVDCDEGPLGERRLGRPFWTMGFEPGLFIGRPCDLPGCAASADPSTSFAHRFPPRRPTGGGRNEAVARDVHRDFCEVAIVAEGRLRSAGRIEARPEALELFGQSLDARDWVAREVTGNAWAIARIIEPHVARVIVVSPSDTGIRQARAKTDRLDARALAKLVWAGDLDGVWTPDARIRDHQEDAPPRTHRRRSAPAVRPRRLVDQRGDAPRRARTRAPSATRLRTHNQRPPTGGRERDTGPRISWLLKRASRAADLKAQVCALTRRRPRRAELSHDRRSPQQAHLTFIRRPMEAYRPAECRRSRGVERTPAAMPVAATRIGTRVNDGHDSVRKPAACLRTVTVPQKTGVYAWLFDDPGAYRPCPTQRAVPRPSRR
jgi:hypothetical protein